MPEDVLKKSPSSNIHMTLSIFANLDVGMLLQTSLTSSGCASFDNGFRASVLAMSAIFGAYVGYQRCLERLEKSHSGTDQKPENCMNKVCGIAAGALLGVYVGSELDYMKDQGVVATYTASAVASVTGMTASLFGILIQRACCGGKQTPKENTAATSAKPECV